MLNLDWERLCVSIPIKVHTAEQALTNIATGIDGTWRNLCFCRALRARHQEGLQRRLKYIDQSLAIKEDWVQPLVKGVAAGCQGDYKDAIRPGPKRPTSLARRRSSFFFESDVKKALSEWKKKF